MPIDPRISLGVQPLQLADPLAQYGQMQNILAAQSQQRAAGTQQQAAELQMQQSQRQIQQDEDYVTKMAEAIGKNGGPTDMMQAARVMSGNRNPQVSATGIQMLQSLQRLDAAKKSGVYGTVAPTAIPSVTPASGALGSGTYDPNAPVAAPMPTQAQKFAGSMGTNLPPVGAANQLAPAPAAPVNQLVDNTAALRAEYVKLSEYSDLPGVKDRMDLIKNQLNEANKLYTVGGNLVTGTGKSVFTAPEKITESEFERNLAKSGLSETDKTTLRIARAKKEATHAPPTTVSYGPQEKAEKIEYGKLLIDDFKNIKAQATVATKSLPAIESNLAILDKGFDTGFGQETKAAGASVLAALGVQNAKEFATDAQTFLANANAAVLQRQLEQKGPQTESDAQRITATGAQLGNTKEANKFVLNVAKAQLQRDLEQRNFYAAWREKNKTFEGAEDAWYAGAGGKSLFESPTLKKYGTNVVDQIPGQSRAAPAATTIPQAAIDALKSGKGTDAQFDAIFGAGAAKRARGGK
jgi:hypothetical protein